MSLAGKRIIHISMGYTSIEPKHHRSKWSKFRIFLYYRNKPMGELGIDRNFVEIKNSTVTLFNQLSSTNQAPNQVELSKM